MSPDKNLAEILAPRMQAGEPIPVPIVLGILRQVCDVLDFAHRMRDPAGNPLVHRDVSPRHIFLAESGTVALTASLTPHSTYAYLAPEYVTSGTYDARADLFGLGVIAHEMLANLPLFATADAQQTIDRVCAMPIPPPSMVNPQVPAELDTIVLMALARDPAHRWQHAAMFRDAILAAAQRLRLDLGPPQLAAWIAGPVAPAPPAPLAPPAWQDDDEDAATRMAARFSPEVPPPPPPTWQDDEQQATRMEAMDPSMFDDLPDLPAPAERQQPSAIEDLPAPVQRQKPQQPKPQQPSAIEGLPAPVQRQKPQQPKPQQPGAIEGLPAPVQRQKPQQPKPQQPSAIEGLPAPVQRPKPQQPSAIESLPAPVQRPKPQQPRSQQTQAPQPKPPQPYPEPPPLQPEPRTQPEPPPSTGFEPELGPEPTQIGAMPLIASSSTGPLNALVGERARSASRAPQLTPLPLPTATYLPPEDDGERRRFGRTHLVIAAIALIVALIVALVLVAR